MRLVRHGKRRLCYLTAMSVAVVLSQGPAASAASVPASISQARADIAKLSGMIAGKTGSTQLTGAAAKVLGQAARFSSRRLSTKPCLSIRVIDAARAPLQSPKTYRAGKVTRFGKQLDALVVRIDKDIIGSGKVKRCVSVGHHTRPITVQKVGNPVKPVLLKPPAEAHTAVRLREPRGAKEFKKLGAPSTITGTKGPAIVRSAVPRADPVLIDRRTDVGVDPVINAPQEVQVTSARGVVLVTGNNGAFVSTDDGVTFSAMSPYTVFGSFQGGFWCDQLIRYSPSVDRFFWLIQGGFTPGNPGGFPDNSYVLAVSSPEAIRAALAAHLPVERAWGIYRLTRSLFGETQTWFDFPTMAVGDHALYLGWNRVNRGVIMARLSLAQLAAGATTSVYYFKQNNATFRQLAQNPGSTGYWTQNFDTNSASVAAVSYLQESSGLLFTALLPHTAIPGVPCAAGDTSPNCGYRSVTPLGQVWTGRVEGNIGGAVGSATVRGNQLWLAWTAARAYPDRSEVWPQPHIQYAAFRMPDSLIALLASGGGISWPTVIEGVVWNANVAIVVPALATSSNGDIGISFAYGGPHNAPSPAAGVIDPLPHELFQEITAGSVFVNPPDFLDQGDYSSIQPEYPGASRFVAAGYVSRLDSGVTDTHWAIMCFGRALAPPPPSQAC